MPPLAEGIVELIVLFGGLCLSTTYPLYPVAAVVSLRSRVRVWVHPNVLKLLQWRLCTPLTARHGYPVFNQAIFVLATSFVFPSVIGAAIVCVGHSGRASQRPGDAWQMFCLFFWGMFGGPLATLPLYTWFSRRIIARTPAEGWPPPAICPNFERDYSQRRELHDSPFANSSFYRCPSPSLSPPSSQDTAAVDSRQVKGEDDMIADAAPSLGGGNGQGPTPGRPWWPKCRLPGRRVRGAGSGRAPLFMPPVRYSRRRCRPPWKVCRRARSCRPRSNRGCPARGD